VYVILANGVVNIFFIYSIRSFSLLAFLTTYSLKNSKSDKLFSKTNFKQNFKYDSANSMLSSNVANAISGSIIQNSAKCLDV